MSESVIGNFFVFFSDALCKHFVYTFEMIISMYTLRSEMILGLSNSLCWALFKDLTFEMRYI